MGITEATTMGSALPVAEMVDAQLLMVAGFVMLGWVLARRQLKMRKRAGGDARAAKKAIRAIREHREPAVPLCDAPPETQRWQIAIFELQRELKAELDTRIAVVQSLTRQLDERIARLAHLQDGSDPSAAVTSAAVTSAAVTSGNPGFTPQQWHSIQALSRSGQAPEQIAERTGFSVDEVRRILTAIPSQQAASLEKPA
jgi:hypothetical protein